MTPPARHIARLEAAGQLAAVADRIAGLSSRLEAAPHWLPGRTLQRQCEEAQRLLTGIAARLEQPLVVTLVGPTGSGKSTLLNALAGVDQLSPAGVRRPTTREVILYGRRGADAGPLKEALGGAQPRMVSSPAAEALSEVLLVDTPDVDSIEGRGQLPLVERIVALSDVLLCVFDAENPKRRDQIDFLAPLVQRFDGEALVALLNKCDRQEAAELQRAIAPDFRRHLAAAWGDPAPQLLCISGRAQLADPAWDPAAAPRHDFNQFDRLRGMIFGRLNRAGQRIDRRLANALQLERFVSGRAAAEARRDRSAREAAAAALSAGEAAARREAIDRLAAAAGEDLSAAQQWLYHHLARRWLGPVGWLIAAWSRLLALGSHWEALRHPLRRRPRAAGQAAPASAGAAPHPLAWPVVPLTACRAAAAAAHGALLRGWPDLSEKLVQARFDPALRSPGTLPPAEALDVDLADHWSAALQAVVERQARGLSHPLLQAVLNLPPLGLLTLVAWATLRDFLAAAYRPAAFFLHALLAVATALLLSFFLFQALARLALGTRRLARLAVAVLRREGAAVAPAIGSPLLAEIAAVGALEHLPPEESIDRRCNGRHS